MQNQSFKDIMKLEIDVTNKLLTYMHSKVDIIDVLDKLDIDLDLYDERNNLAFNIWLSVDYIDEDGKSFIDKLLIDKSQYLTKLEREVLQEKSSSFVSLFEILSFEDKTVLLKDILNDIEYEVLEPSIHNVIEAGEFLFTRIGNVLGNFVFMGDINYVPSSVKDRFLEELLVDFNLIRKDNPNLSMIDYLKNYALNLYQIYNDSLIDIIESSGDMSTFFYDELDEFETFLLTKYKDITVKKFLTNLSNIFEYALADNDMTLSNIDRIDLSSLFNEAIDDDFINSQEELNSYITTLKAYLHYLSMRDSKYEYSYSQILEISKDRFKLMSKLDTNNSFNLDKDLSSLIAFSLNEQAMSVIFDYDKFILYNSDSDMKVTSTKKHIKRKDLLNLNNILENSMLVEKKAPNQDDFPLIHLFFYASMDNDILQIDGSNLILTNKGHAFLRLDDEEKYTLLIQYLWSEECIEDMFGYSNSYIIAMLRDRFTDSLSKLKVNKLYSIDELSFGNSLGFYSYYGYLFDLGLLGISYDSYRFISITGLGKKIFKFIDQRNNTAEDNEIIILDDFKKAKNSLEG